MSLSMSSALFGDLKVKALTPGNENTEILTRVDQAFKRLESDQNKHGDSMVPEYTTVDGELYLAEAALAATVRLAGATLMAGVPFKNLDITGAEAKYLKVYALGGDTGSDLIPEVDITLDAEASVTLNADGSLSIVAVDDDTTIADLITLLKADADAYAAYAFVPYGTATTSTTITAEDSGAPADTTQRGYAFGFTVGGVLLPVSVIDDTYVEFSVPAYVDEAGNPVKEWLDLLKDGAIRGTLTGHLNANGHDTLVPVRFTTLVDTSQTGDMLPSVDDFFDPTDATPADPDIGDRYISEATANGWTDKYIYEWDGSEWDETVPNEGNMVEIETGDEENTYYSFIDGDWVDVSTLLTHNMTIGLQGGQADEYYHTTAAQNTALSKLDMLTEAGAGTKASLDLLDDTDVSAFKVTLQVADLAADRTLTLSDEDVDLADIGTNTTAIAANTLKTAIITLAGAGTKAVVDVFDDTDVSAFKVSLQVADLAADRTITLPDADVDLADVATNTAAAAANTLKTAIITLADADDSAKIELAEDTDNGVHKVTIKPVAALAADWEVSLPDADVDLYPASRMHRANVTIGDTGTDTAALTVDLLTMAGASLPVGAGAKVFFIFGTATQYMQGAGEASLTYNNATKGSILAQGNGFCAAKSDVNGEFACDVVNTDNETLYFYAKTADMVDDVANGCIIFNCVGDDATWS